MTLYPIAPRDSLWSGEMMSARAGRFRVVVLNVDGRLKAYEDRCLHKGVPLSEGRFEGTRLVCRAHAWEYDACTGQGINPCEIRLRSFPVVVREGQISVEIEEDA
jgi:toluene monooxygenase system ferredoxin subunit